MKLQLPRLAISPAFAGLLIAAMPSIAAADTADSLMRAGLGPDALAAAGISSGEVATLIADAETYIDANSTELSDADADYVSLRAEVDALRRKVRSGQASAEEISSLATKQSQLATAESDRESAIEAIFDAATDSLSAAEKTALANIQANRTWATPIEFLVINRTDQQWLDLSEALTNEAVANEEGTAVEAACANLLLTERAKTEVASAKTNFDANVSAVTTAWNTAVSGS